MADLPPEIQAELAQKAEQLIAVGMPRKMARQQVWQEYQAELVATAAGVASVASVAEAAKPELPPPKPRIPPAATRSDSGDTYWKPERMARNRAELAKLKTRLGMKHDK